MGVRLLQELFYEMSRSGKQHVLYTLKDRDHKGYPSLYRLYMEMEDIAEWDFANKYLESYEHWQMICRCKWFKLHISRWRRELELKVKSRCLKKIMDEAKSDSHLSIANSKYLLEKGWRNDENRAQRGRPSKKEIIDEATKIADIDRQITQDFERIIN